MFSNKLANALLVHLYKRKLACKAASEMYDPSPRHIAQISRRKTAPALNTLKKRRKGPPLFPSKLLSGQNIVEALTYRTPMAVNHYYLEPSYTGPSRYAACPRCSNAIEYDYQNFCGCCGQMLDWENYEHAKPLTEVYANRPIPEATMLPDAPSNTD